jgi:hypothetical protein
VNLLHNLLADPFLPVVGEVYWVATEILDRRDEKPRRPAVVIKVPASLNGRVVVVTRTTDLDAPGVPHGASPELDLDVEGVFAQLRTAEARLWYKPNVEWLGPLGKFLLEKVIEEFLG